MKRINTNLAIIGGGSAGMAAARKARKSGLSVTLFEQSDIGGTCVNLGCVPKKLFVQASRVSDQLAEMIGLGWSSDLAHFDWPTLRSRVTSETERLSRYHRDRLINAGVTLVSGQAVFEDSLTLRCGNTHYAFETALIATGAVPVKPPISSIEHALISDDLFALEKLPARLAIIGGGYIATEFACLLTRFGVSVTLFEMSDRLVSAVDADIATRLHAALLEQGVDVQLNTQVSKISSQGEGVDLTVKGRSDRQSFGAVFVAVGRRPNSNGLGLEAIGVDLAPTGHIRVDEIGQTSLPTIYAAGDVCEHMALTPVAVRGARRMIAGLLQEPDSLPQARYTPTAIFTTPECGAVGLTEAAARKYGFSFSVRTQSFRPLAAKITNSDTEVFMKAIVQNISGKLLGLHFFGPHASEAAQLGALAISAGLTEKQLHNTMALHPSIGEEIIGLGVPDQPLHQKPVTTVRPPQKVA